MAFVDSGPVDATDRFDATPRNRWPHLMRAKRTFLATKLIYDCRCLVDFVAEAESVWCELKFSSAEDMIRKGYELDPVEIELAVAWLRHNEPDVAIGLGDVNKAAVAEARANPAMNQGRPTKEESINGCTTTIKGKSTRDHITKRLARDNRDDLLDAIEAGELSVNAAAIRAGYRKKLSHAEKCVAAFRKAENRLEPLRIIVAELDPHEREVLKDWLTTPTPN